MDVMKQYLALFFESNAKNVESSNFTFSIVLSQALKPSEVQVFKIINVS